MLRKYSPRTPPPPQNQQLNESDMNDDNSPEHSDTEVEEKTLSEEEYEGGDGNGTSVSSPYVTVPQISQKPKSVLDTIDASIKTNDGRTSSIISSYFSRNAELLQKKAGVKRNEAEGSNESSLGSVFEQLRILPSGSYTIGDKLESEALSGSTCSSEVSTSTSTETSLSEASSDAKMVSPHSKQDSSLMVVQRGKNFQLLSSWTDDGEYSRVQAMAIAVSLYNSKVTESEIRAELTPKEKFAYKKFCLEIEDKLQTLIKYSYGTIRDALCERTLRKIWHLYALYTKALSEIWDKQGGEDNANSDITSCAITHLVKRTIAGPSDTENGQQQSHPKPADPLEHMNPVLAKCLQDPTYAFLIVYGRYCSTGRMSTVDRLRKLNNFNEIAQQFFEKLAEPPQTLDVDTYLLHLRTQQIQHDSVGNSNFMKAASLPISKSRKSRRHRHHHRRKRHFSVTKKSALLERIDGATQHHENSSNPKNEGGAMGGSHDVNMTDMKTIQRKIQMLDGKKRICLYGCRYDVLPVVANEAGFELVGENELWNINWSDSPLPQEKISQMRRIQDTYSVFWGVSAPLQKTNHFPGMYEICRKDRLGRNLNRLRRIFPNDYNFFPDTFDLPTEQGDLLSYSKRRKNQTFIIKPESGCQGKGIFLLRNLRKLPPFTKCVCQVYVPTPFLIDGYKFDQRIYVLITCVDPLRLYIYDEGIARFATVKYESPTDENLEVVFMHLTNYSLNKFSESYVREGDGSKRKLSAIYKWMSENGHDVPKLIRAIDDIVVKTLLCAAPTLRHNYKTSFPKRDRGCSCFELLGFDILIDRQMNPVLLEVNHSPSFNLDLPVDSEVKKGLLRDMFDMVYLGDDLIAAKQRRGVRRGESDKFQAGESSASQTRKNGKRKTRARSPPSPVANEPPSSPDGLPKPLTRQFQHEVKNRGKFRLIYSSERPGKYAKLVDETYCGYPATSPTVGMLLEQILDHQQPQQAKKNKPINNSVIFECDRDDWQLQKTSSVLKMTKKGQPYVETRVIPSEPACSTRSQRIQGLVQPAPESDLALTRNNRFKKMQEYTYLQRKTTSGDKMFTNFSPNFNNYYDDEIDIRNYTQNNSDDEKGNSDGSAGGSRTNSGGGCGGGGTKLKFQLSNSDNKNNNKR